MPLEEATLVYWKMSQHFRRGLTTDAEKAAFLLYNVGPRIIGTKCHHEKQLLSKLTQAA